MDDDPRYDVRISDPGEVAAAIPYLLGFRPRESVVLVSLTGTSGGRVGLTVRVDIPPPGSAPAVARALAASVGSDRPAGVLVALVSEAPDERGAGDDGSELPHRELVHRLVVALAAGGIPVRDALLVREERWWSYDCPYACCAPGGGTPLPAGVSELEVASVAAGLVLAPDRDQLAARIAPIGEPARSAMAAVTARVGDRYARAVLADAAAVAGRSWTAILAAVARCRADPRARGRGEARSLSDHEVARVLWALADVRIRDRALGLALGDDAAAAEALWTECTRRAPAPLDAAPATLLAVSAWLRGDGATANVALARALDSRPGYPLADLLAQGLAACLPPGDLRAMVRAVAADLDDAARADHAGPTG